jgi:hypothetical protein
MEVILFINGLIVTGLVAGSNKKGGGSYSPPFFRAKTLLTTKDKLLD